jgi:3-oxoacyl-(acyl-carrier-protein) synthase
LNDRSTLVCAVASEAHAIRHAVDTIVTDLILMGSDS